MVVSNDSGNTHSPTIEVVYLTTQPKNDLPTHVVVRATGRDSVALCEQVTTVSLERVGDFCGECTKAEMQHIDIALMVSLALGDTQPHTSPPSRSLLLRQRRALRSWRKSWWLRSPSSRCSRRCTRSFSSRLLQGNIRTIQALERGPFFCLLPKGK